MHHFPSLNTSNLLSSMLIMFVLLLYGINYRCCSLQGMGFEKGWGDTAERVLEMMHLLSDILQAPDPASLETFLGRIPMVFNVVILSVHGFFGQANVLGLPDTGGQVVVFMFFNTANIKLKVFCVLKASSWASD